MKPVCDRLQPDWELVCMGALDPSEMDEALQHVRSGCVVCNERFRIANEAVAAVGSSLPPKTPPRWNEQALLNRIASDKQRPQAVEESTKAAGPQRATAQPFPFAWAIAAALAVAALLGWWQEGEARRQLNDARSTIAALRATPSDSSRDAAANRPATTEAASTGKLRAEPRQADMSAVPTTVAETSPSSDVENALAASNASLLAELSGLREQVDELLRQVATAKQEKNLLFASYEAAESELKRLRQERQEMATARTTGNRGEDAEVLNDAEVQRVLRELQDSRRQQTLLAAELERTQRVLRILRAGDLRQVELQATDEKAGPGHARLLVSPREGLVLVARQLPKLPADKTYQLWIIGETNPAVVSGGLLRMDDGDAAVVVSGSSETLRRATGFAITDEPRTGSIVAKGTKLMFGAL